MLCVFEIIEFQNHLAAYFWDYWLYFWMNMCVEICAHTCVAVLVPDDCQIAKVLL